MKEKVVVIKMFSFDGVELNNGEMEWLEEDRRTNQPSFL